MPGTIPSILKILIVEDDEDDFFIIKDYLMHLEHWKCEVYWIYKYDEAVKALCSNQYSLCFSDYRLGMRNGVDLLRDIREGQSRVPVILLTGKGNYAIDMEAAKEGAFDYLIKSEIDEDTLDRTIRYAMERYSNLQRLKDSERKYRNVFNKSKDIVFVSDLTTRITTVNPAISDVLDISIEDAIGKCVTDFFKYPEQLQLFKERLERDGEIENYEVSLESSKNQLKTCLITVSEEIDSIDRRYLQGFIHDMTQLKRAEVAGLQLEKLAATGRFIRTLAHEVRNPLNNINLAVENLLQQPLSEDDRVCMEIISRNSGRINDLITELLQSSRTVEMNPRATSLRDLVEDTIRAIQDKVLLRRINVSFEVEQEQIFQIQADDDKLRMAMLNVLVNAVEAVQEDTGIIEVKLVMDGKFILLSISDNGCGMSQETRARLFEPYFTSKRNGLGLGLATTLTILNAHNASIEVYSQLNSGSCFEIRFQTYHE